MGKNTGRYLILGLTMLLMVVWQAVFGGSINGYNLYLPIFGSILLYLVSLVAIPRINHNFIWNSVMLLGLIPSFVFGMLMVWTNLSSSLLYWHVEFSAAFGTACVMHLLLRIKIYFSQGITTFRSR